MKVTTWTHPTTGEKRVYLNDGIWSNDVKVFINEKMDLKIIADWRINRNEIENYVWDSLSFVQSFEDVSNYVEQEEVVIEEETTEIEVREVRKDVSKKMSNGVIALGEIIEEIEINGQSVLVVDFGDFSGARKVLKSSVTIL